MDVEAENVNGPPTQCLYRLSRSRVYGQVITFGLTYIAFCLNHATRKTLSEVKPSLESVWLDTANESELFPIQIWGNSAELFATKDQASDFLGYLDALFMAAYATGLFISGWLGDRGNPRLFLSGSLIFSGLILIMFGTVSEWAQLYSVPYYVVTYGLFGLLQSVCIPNCVAIMTNWTHKSTRGSVLGFWSSSQSAGNIVGALVTAWVLPTGYQNTFLVNSALMTAWGTIVFAGLVVDPGELGEDCEYKEIGAEVESSVNEHNDDPSSQQPISFLAAVALPSVAIYSLCVLCLKMVNYSFFFWLPFYLSTDYGWPETVAATASIAYDVGAIIGSTAAGIVTDHLGFRSPVLFACILVSVPLLYMYKICACSLAVNVIVVGAVGLTIGGPYNLITAAIAADLGRQPALHGNKHALATVTGIIDGTGSVGSAIGLLVISPLNNWLGWSAVFWVFIVVNSIATLCLVKLAYVDTKELIQRWRGHEDENRPLLSDQSQTR